MKSTVSNRAGESVVNAPLLHINPCSDCSRMNSSDFRPFGHSQAFTLKRKQSATASVSRLLAARSPLTVGRLVISKIVFALNAVIRRWAFPHVSNEVFKTSPSFTHLNTACSIVLVLCIVFVAAPAVHTTPNDMDWLLASAVSDRSCSRFPPATAAYRPSNPKPSSGVGFDVAAIAFANPRCPAFFCSLRMQPDNCQMAEALTRHILKIRTHGSIYTSELPVMTTTKIGGFLG